ncbi:T9SS type B sorting domain-containing protein [Lacinutrix sp. C3R15]|uniref:T9SS type B sorting domain-containing protein n=1 Tax=Flavobacteriaceae TaxID=49546 RepID=UPI001C08862B|nr:MULTISPECIES: T9SS type B sorting domain-containing protein [Flavobacteriaceae]MBU2939452.1 T9SS type B sorting domain-containing protein [Lacinutrix sp. C3R15]MDO6622767.1 T9SS type B sorting domain-containing protein [Oceanihabitans sp. 1_MG-2023]
MRFFLIILTLCSTFAYGQLSDKHWLPPLHSRGLTDFDQYVYLSTPEPTPFQVVVTNGNGVPVAGSPFTISQNNPVSFSVGTAQPSLMLVEQSGLHTASGNSGLILEGTSDFYVTFKINRANHGEIIVSKGRDGTGTNFRLGSLPQISDDSFARRNFVSSFMATEDATTVTVSDYAAGVTFTTAAGTTNAASQTFNLNAGESVVLSGYTNVPANLTGFIGAQLLSNKPIAVNTGNIIGGTIDGFNDINLDQIVSLEQVGTEYIFIRGNGSDNTELPLLIATDDNTEVFINGSATPYTTLVNAGDYITIPSSYYQGTANQNVHILTNKPIYSYQVIAGSTEDRTTGLNFIPPISCSFPTVVDLMPSIDELDSTSGNSFPTDLFVLTTVDSAISINGTPTTASSQAVLGNPNWVTYRISGHTGNIKAESTGPMSIGIFGSSGTVGYAGHYSGFKEIPIVDLVEVCPEDTVNLFDAITGGNVASGGTWSPALASGTDIFDASQDNTGIYTYTVSQTCGDTSVDVTVAPLPVPTLTSISSNSPICENEDAIFTLNGTPNSTVTYSINAGADQTVVLDASGNIDINLGPVAEDQFITASQIENSTFVCITALNETDSITVNPLPELINLTSNGPICENEEAIFTLEGTPNAIITYTINGGAAQTTNLDNNGDATVNLGTMSTDQTIAVSQIESASSGCSLSITETETINVSPLPTLTSVTNNSPICENEDAIFTVNGTSDTTLTYTINGSAIQSILLDSTGEAMIVLPSATENQILELVAITYSSTTICETPLNETQTIAVGTIPQPLLEGGSNCVDPDTGLLTQSIILNSNIQGDLSNYEFSWFYNNTIISGATESTYEADQVGSYYVTVVNTIANCSNTSNVVSVDEIDEATDFTYTVSNAFSNNPTIVVTVIDGDGTFLYQLDDLNFQNSNTFTGVSPGTHTVTVIDIEGCTFLTKEVTVIDYPLFFTPNADTYNDYWNIFSLSNQPDAKIYIFDRYGKLLKFLKPTDAGWDGTYNSQPLPASDYWFTVEFRENEKKKIFNAHFSLKR